MILRTVRMEDFGLYAGPVDFDLTPRESSRGTSPIILVGGKNGAGKTTLLEAVRLALYGKRALGVRIGQSEYEDYLRDRINRGSKATGASVTLEFDYAENGIVHRYLARREWAVKGKSVVESLLLERDGTVLITVPREEWHLFLQELIPPGVSQLFFFDGEKIRDIADGEQDNDQLAEAIRALLGIDVVGRLRTDIGLFLARSQRAADDSLSVRLESTVRDLRVVEEKVATTNEDVAQLRSTRDSQARAAEQVRRRFVAEGGDAAVHRARTESELLQVRDATHRNEQEVRDLAGKLLPFTVAPILVASFRAALEEVGTHDDKRAAVESLRESFKKWRSTPQTSRKARWQDAHWDDLNDFVSSQFSTKAPHRNRAAFREVGDGAAALARLTEADVVVLPRARQLLTELDAFSKRERELQGTLDRANSAASGQMLDELRLAEQKVGASDASLVARQEDLRVLRGQVVTFERERRRLLDEQTGAAASSEKTALAARASQALAEYERRLLDHKLSRLRSEFVSRFNSLARKGDLVADIRIDPITFAATLIDRRGSEVPKAALSAGEKQIYAIAMLWALAKTSGRPLPMIIDTPLARLDSEHRSNLIQRYFPAASHQVILLSTDTEIDHELLNELGSNVSHTFRLDYDPTNARTRVHPGYFNNVLNRVRGKNRELQQA